MNDKNFSFANINLPSILLGPAGQAISQLIGIPIEMLTARLERPLRAIEARTKAQEAFQIEAAKELAKIAIADPDFQDRAMASFARELAVKQENREAVAKETVQQLAEESPAPEPDPDEQVSSDWMNFFGAYAEKASSAEMRELWGSILAGEIRKPGAYSLKTLRILSELDQCSAQAFQKLAEVTIAGWWLPLNNEDRKTHMQSILNLSERGLVKYPGFGEHLEFLLNQDGIHLAWAPGSKSGYLARGEPDKVVHVDGAGLLETGKEILTLFSCSPAPNLRQLILNAYRKDHLFSISDVQVSTDDQGRMQILSEEIFWKK